VGGYAGSFLRWLPLGKALHCPSMTPPHTPRIYNDVIGSKMVCFFLLFVLPHQKKYGDRKKLRWMVGTAYTE
jgi:hypothetical protein